MALDRELAMFEHFELPDFANVAAVRQWLKSLSDQAPPLDGALSSGIGITERQIPGPANAPPLRIRIYRPADSGPAPVLLYFHSGSFLMGGLDTDHVSCLNYARMAQTMIISVDYRLAPEHKFPAGVEDAYAATKWVAANASSIGVDPARIVVAGDSAGGNLAAVVCQQAKTGGPKIALQVLFCPVVDIGAENQSRLDFAEGYFLERPLMIWAGTHYLFSGVDIMDPRLSPLRAADLSGLPPAHIHTAGYDPLRDEAKDYADSLEGAGVKVRYTCHEHMIHHFYAMAGAIPYAKTHWKRRGARTRPLSRGKKRC